jgi:hypothetical protein
VTDIALVMENEVLAHRANCPIARQAAAQGKPVLTMFQCSEPLPGDIKRHSCLDEQLRR